MCTTTFLAKGRDRRSEWRPRSRILIAASRQYGLRLVHAIARNMGPAAAEFDLFGEHTPELLEGCHNPKPSSADKANFGRLASLYTAFSSDFASFALQECLSRGHTRIADPFAGMGTLGEAARVRSLDLALNDLNPFAVASCCVRTAGVSEIAHASDAVRSLISQSRGEDDEERFRLTVEALLPVGQWHGPS